jgi:hypothetical protein
MTGRRVPDGEWFTWASRRGGLRIKPGDYGCVPYTNGPADWFVCCPDGSYVRLWVNDEDRNGNRHTVTEHEDGTITVGGSILGHDVPSLRIGGVGPISSETWHGWLEQGVWRST